ncbi:hypothetical protein MTO96_035656 [Rhipicephalus appendiculatus]
MDFALVDEYLVATEELTTDERATSVSEKGTIADSSSSDPNDIDDIGAPHPVTSGAALAAVDALRIYQSFKSDWDKGLSVSYKDIQVTARSVANGLEIARSDFKIAKKWVTNFMSLNGLSLRRCTTVCQKPPDEYDEKEGAFLNFVRELKAQHAFMLSQIGNADQTPVWFDMPGKRNVSAKVKGIQSIGKGVTALADFCATLNLSHRGLHHNTLRGHMDTMVDTCQEAATATEKASVEVVKTLYKDFLSPVGNGDVIFDGTWKTRGHNSNIAVGCIIDLYTTWCWIHIVLSSYCRG